MLSDRFLLSARWIGSVVLVLSTMPNLWAQTATAPTASEDPVSIDQVWQKVSSKYDAKRQTLLSEVPDTIPGILTLMLSSSLFPRRIRVMSVQFTHMKMR